MSIRPAWYGKEIDPNSSLEQMIIDGGLDYELEKRPLFYYNPFEKRELLCQFPEDGEVQSKLREVVVRTDTNQELSVVSPRFKLDQPREVAEFYREAIEKLGFSISFLGPQNGGKSYFCMARVGETYKFLSECVEKYILLIDSCDGSHARKVYHINMFPACWNILPGLTPIARSTHSSEWDVEAFRDKVGIGSSNNMIENIKEYEEFAKYKKLIAYDFFAEVVAKHTKFSETNEEWLEVYKDEDACEATHPTQVAKLLEIYHNETLPGRKDTLWGAINAVTYWTDHVRGKDANRGWSVLGGASNVYKNSALSLARELIGQ